MDWFFFSGGKRGRNVKTEERKREVL